MNRRADGFHSIESLMLKIDLCDRLEFWANESDILLTCEHSGIPTDERNLVVKAALLLKEYSSTKFGTQIRLSKSIPHEAGLGGGSSDAATTLLALNELWRLNYPLETLQDIAARIGSDVAFFLYGPAAWCTGRGEIVSPEVVGSTMDFVVVKPPIGLSTREVYQAVQVSDQQFDSSLARSALRTGDSVSLGRALFNRLQPPAFEVAPSVESLYSELSAYRPLGCQLSGSGSALFALCHDALEANRIASAIRDNHADDPVPLQVIVCRSWHTPSFLRNHSR